MTEPIRSEVDVVEAVVSNDPAAVLVEVDGAIVVARIDANTSKRSIKKALLEVNAQLERAINYRSGLVDVAEEEKKLVTDGGQELPEYPQLPSTFDDLDNYRDQAELVLDAYFPDRIYTVEERVIWVSGMNQHCRHVARKMARTLSQNGVPAGLVYDDDAVRFGGVQFNYGGHA